MSSETNALKNIPEDLINKAHEDLFEKQECREIVKEIMDFQPSQRQLVEIINLLSLELCDVKQMKKIRNAIKKIKGNALIIAKAE
ncbi:MAG: hypothetical protein AABY22_31760 [Nanoarchaeota archaeon]